MLLKELIKNIIEKRKEKVLNSFEIINTKESAVIYRMEIHEMLDRLKNTGDMLVIDNKITITYEGIEEDRLTGKKRENYSIRRYI